MVPAWIRVGCVSGLDTSAYVFFSCNLQSERFFVEAVVVFDIVQGFFLERSFDPMQNVVRVMLLRPGRSISIVDQIFENPVRGVFFFLVGVRVAHLQGLNRGERLKLPSFWEIDGWKTSVRNWTCGTEFG